MMNSAKIVALTKPTAAIDSLNAPLSIDEFIAYVARVSNPANQNNTLTAKKLLQYLVKNKHWSPFEMASVVMEINTTRDIGRQILRHRSFSFQEFSQRYADPTKMDAVLDREFRLQDIKNRQNSIESADENLQSMWEAHQRSVDYVAKGAYTWAINNGIAKEQARAVLPEGLTPTKMYMAGSLRSWIHYVLMRCSNGTQKEHRLVAISAREELIQHFPSLTDVLIEAQG